MYRLKSCIDFKPYEGEKTYIKFEKRGGYGSSFFPFCLLEIMLLLSKSLIILCVFCLLVWFARCFSSVGDQQTGQILSLGSGCDHKAVIEHELLHALGFYHEQSRTDRDDYVDIWLDQVTPGTVCLGASWPIIFFLSSFMFCNNNISLLLGVVI